MESLYSFFKSLVPGDVITSSGCKGIAKKNEQILTVNREHHRGWGKYARITDTKPEIKASDKQINIAGVRWEGIDPSTHDMFAHVASEIDNSPNNLRKASKAERKVFMQEYLKTRIEIADHMAEEAKDILRRAKKTSRNLSKIAQEEKIDTEKLLKRKEK